MSQLHGQTFKVKGLLSNENGALSFLGLGTKVTALPFLAKKLPHLNFESVEAELSFTADFVAVSSYGRPFRVSTKKDSDLAFSEISLNVPDLGANLEKFNIFNPNSESLKALVMDQINLDIINGRFEKLQAEKIKKIPWTEAEERIALDIYVATKGADYADMLALVSEKVDDGEFHEERSKDSVEMKVNTFKSLDNNSGVDGLSSVSGTSRELWEKYKKGELS